ncbi:MAG: hypothetical protein V4543_11245 [Bacteroidota bacterium]
MKKLLLTAAGLCLCLFAQAQVAGIFEPGISVTPAGATAEDSITISFLPNKTCFQAASMVGHNTARMHAGLIRDTATAWGGWSDAHDWSNGPETAFRKAADGTWYIKIKPRGYFSILTSDIPAGNIQGMRFVVNGANSTTDANAWNFDARAFRTIANVQGQCGDFAIPFPVPNWLATSLCTLPAPFVTPNGPLDFCSGGSVQLMSNMPTGNIWSTGETSQLISVNTPGTYTVRQVSNGCTSDASSPIMVTVRTLPNSPTIISNGPLSFCSGGSVTLSSTVADGNLWTTGETTPSITVSSAGTVSLSTIANGCTVSAAPVSIVVSAKPGTPEISASGPLNVCGTGTVTLTSSATRGNLWNTGDTTRSITVSASGSYYVQLTNSGCSGDTSLHINITHTDRPAPVTPVASGPTAFCNGESVNLSVTGTYAAYLWSNGATTPGITVSTGGNYWVRVAYSASGCWSDTIGGTYTQGGMTFSPIGAGAHDEITIEANTDVICGGLAGISPIRMHSGTRLNGVRWQKTISTVGASEPLTRFGSESGKWVKRITPFAYYHLSANDTLSELDMVLNGGASTGPWYQFDGKDFTNACGDFFIPIPVPASQGTPATINITVYPTDAPTVTSSGSLTLCAGSSVTLTSNYLHGNTWSTGDTTQSLTVASAGNYTVTHRAQGCTSSASAAQVVTVGQKPAMVVPVASGPLVFCQGESVDLTAPAGFAAYLWSNGETTQNITVRTAGNYWVRVANLPGCWSDTITGSITKSGLTLSPIGAGLNDSITIDVDLTQVCGTLKTAVNPIPVRLHSGVRIGTTRFSNAVSTTGALEPLTHFTQAGTRYTKRILPRTYFRVPATQTADEIEMVLNGGNPVGGWFEFEGKDVSNACGDFIFPLPLPLTGGTRSAVTVSVTPIAPAPVITASGPAAICSGSSITLTSSALTGNIWSTGDTNRTITVNQAGNYSVRQYITPCTSEASSEVAVSIIERPAPQAITASGPAKFCAGDSVILSAAPGFPLYRWSTGETTPSITVRTSGRYWVRVANNNACWSDTITGTYNQSGLSFSPINAGPDDMITISLDKAHTCGSLRTAATADPVRIHSGIRLRGVRFRNTISTTNAVVEPATRFTNAAGLLTKMLVPRAYYHTTATDTINEMDIVLNGGSDNGANWFEFEGKDSSNACGNYYIPLPIPADNGISTGISITVYPSPAIPVVTASGPLSFCGGTTVTLTSSAFEKYRWSNGDTTRSITVSTSGNYTVKGINAVCTSAASAALAVAVTPKPAAQLITLTGSLNLCAGDSVTLSAAPGLPMYLWSNGATTHSIRVGTGGHYWVRAAYNVNCWSDTLSGGYRRSGLVFSPAGAGPDDSITITLDRAHTCGSLRTAGGPAPVRWHSGIRRNGTRWQNTISTLSAADEPLTGFLPAGSGFIKKIVPRSYYRAAAGDTITELNAVLNAGTRVGGWFEFEGKDSSNTCGDYLIPLPIPQTASASTAVNVIVKPKPAPARASAAGSPAICEGSVLTLNSDSVRGNLWNTGATTRSITVTAAGSYWVSIVANGCTSVPSNIITVSTTPLPEQPQIISNVQPIICEGDSVTLSSTVAGRNIWSNGDTSQSITVRTAGSFTVSSIANGCTSLASAVTTVSVNSRPAPPVISFSGATLTASPGVEFTWYLNGVVIPEERNGTLFSYGDGVYTATVTDVNGCKSLLSNVINVTEIKKITGSGCSIVPNPAQSEFSLHGLKGNADIIIHDAIGREVHRQNVQEGEAIRIGYLPAGMYHVSAGGKTLRLVKN